MSVTLKLADEDAAVIASILKRVAERPDPPSSSATTNEYKTWYYGIRNAHAGRDLDKILELAGAFTVAVRANQR